MKKLIILLALAFCLNAGAQCIVTISITSNNATCGLANGSATVTASGGTPAYSYTWSPSGGNASIANNLSVGTYTCIVEDGIGCFVSTIVVITQQPFLMVTINSTNATCNVANDGGLANGSATITATGGTPPYTYNWSPLGGTTATASNLTAGIYTVSVADSIGCEVVSTITINQPPPINIVFGHYDSVFCIGSYYTITYTITGGTNPLQVYWFGGPNNNASSSSLTAVNIYQSDSNTTYGYQIFDANNCQDYASASSPIVVDVKNCVAGIEQYNTNNNISVYPNPASSSLKVLFSGNSEGSTLLITDMLGNTVKQVSVSSNQLSINVADLNEGVYTISLTSGAGIVNKRVVIVR